MKVDLCIHTAIGYLCTDTREPQLPRCETVDVILHTAWQLLSLHQSALSPPSEYSVRCPDKPDGASLPPTLTRRLNSDLCTYHVTHPLYITAYHISLHLTKSRIMAKPKAKPNKNAILLSDVETLTLRGRGAKTSHRRVSAIPQLKCISSPSLCSLAEDNLELMRCTNQGSSYDDTDVEWTCAATLPEELRLGSTDVICEGYSGPDDPYVLKGSCGVEYRVALTPKGERRYPDLESRGGSAAGWFPTAFIILFVAVLGWIIYSGCTNYQANTRRGPANRRGPRGGGGGWGGGGGGGGPGWDPRFGGPGDSSDPPPPYPGRKPASSSTQSGWGPGFWSGLAGGTAAGYAASSLGRNRGNRRDDNIPLVGRRGGSSSYSGSSSSAGPSGTSHESTGFGSTSRR